jgi:HEAT repeat protein
MFCSNNVGNISDMISFAAKTIDQLIAYASTHDLSLCGRAVRELLRRGDECLKYAPQIVQLLQHCNAAVRDLAFRLLERLGAGAVAAVIEALQSATDRFRSYLISLLPVVADFETWFPVLNAEFQGDDDSIRYHAANCIARCYDKMSNWPDHAMTTLDRCIALLRSCIDNDETRSYWPQARMTLRGLGLLGPEAV